MEIIALEIENCKESQGASGPNPYIIDKKTEAKRGEVNCLKLVTGCGRQIKE